MDYYNQQLPQQPQAPQQPPPQTLAQMQYQYQQQYKYQQQYQDQEPSEVPSPPPPPNNPAEKSVMNVAVKGIALVIGLFIIGYLGGALKNIQRIDTFQTQNNNTQLSDTTLSLPDGTTETTLPDGTTLTTTAEYKEKETTSKLTTTKPTTTKPTTTADIVIDSKEEIVELFNSSANNVKKSAKKVTRLYENRRHDEDLSDYPAVWNTVGGTLIDSWLVNHDTPIEYEERELIIANFPVKGETWSSKLLPEDVAHATCEEVDGYYEIEIYLDYCIDPEENRGPLAVMEEVNTEIVQEFVDIVTDCSVEYYDCMIRCSIEKETGNLVHIKYSEPMALTLTTKRFTTLTGLFAMTFESEYDIIY